MNFDHYGDAIREYAAGCVVEVKYLTDVTFPVTVEIDFSYEWQDFPASTRVNLRPLTDFLWAFWQDALVLGSPGSGKSHGMKQYAVSRAVALVQSRPSEPTDGAVIPVYLDLKLYDGDLRQLLSPRLSQELLDAAIEAGALHFLIDSFNEAPRQYLEDGTLAADLRSWMSQTDGCRWTITSRTTEGLDFFKASRFVMRGIEADFVRKELERKNVDLSQRHAKDLVELLQKPMFFAAFARNRLKLQPDVVHPAQAIGLILASFEIEIWMEFQIYPDLTKALGSLAAEAVDSGGELLDRQRVTSAIHHSLGTVSISTAERIVERMIEKDLLLYWGGQNLAFFHQSITEYIAARHMAARLAEDMSLLDRLMSSTRWDHTLHLVTHFLDASQMSEFIKRMIAIDLRLGIRCARLAEYDRHVLTSGILDALASRPADQWCYDYSIIFPLKSLPVDSIHAPRLRSMLKLPAYSGGIAEFLLAEAIGVAAIEPILETVFASPDDFGVGQMAGQALVSLLEPHHIGDIFRRINECPLSSDKSKAGDGVAQLVEEGLKNLDPALVVAEFRATQPSRLGVMTLCAYATNVFHPAVVDLLIDLLLTGSEEAAFPLYAASRRGFQPQLIERIVQPREMAAIEAMLVRPQACRSIVDLIGELSKYGDAIHAIRKELIERSVPAVKVALLCQIPQCASEFWKELELLVLADRELQDFEYSLLKSIQDGVDWSEHIGLLQKGIDREDCSLTEALIGSWGVIAASGLTWDWVKSKLPWFEQAKRQKHHVTRSFSKFVVPNLDAESKQKMWAEFDSPMSPFRDSLADYFLPSLVSEANHQLSNESMTYLVQRLHHNEFRFNDPDLLAAIATPEVVESSLIPLVDNAENLFQKNLRTVLKFAGERHRRRYV